MEAVHWATHQDGWFIHLRDSKLWACDECLIDKKAIEANPREQIHGYNDPHLAYFDKGRVCTHCNDHFVFSKTEQQFWYEELQILVFVNPKNCLKCRRQIRAINDRNTELSNILVDRKNLTRDQLNRVIELYEEMGIDAKVKYYQAMLRKLV